MEKERLHELFRFSGILPHYQGYEYLEEAVLMAVENPMRLQNIQEGIYLPIARKHHVSQNSVEKALRTVRDSMIKHGGLPLFSEISGYQGWTARTPYPKEIICIFADYLTHLS